jgi:nucleotide-binding universal stress UspA family protein
LALSAFEKGKLKIAAHVREELELARIPFEAIHCKSGGVHIPTNVMRLVVIADGAPRHLDLASEEVEDCDVIVVGETWHRIAAFLESLK